MKMARAFSLIFWAAVLALFLTPMELGDIWWHLKTGEWIWQEKALISEDPFSLSTGGNPFVHRAFWLSQVLFHLIEKGFGLHGLIVFKAIVFTATVFVLNLTLKLYGLKPPLSYALVVPMAAIATAYDETRPQIFSFFFFALLIYLLEGRRRGNAEGRAFFFILPPAMLLWANMHAGFVLGVGVLFLYMLREALTEGIGAKNRSFFLIASLSSAVTVLNPNWAEAFVRTARMFFRSKEGTAAIHEHLPVREFAEMTSEGLFYYTTLGLIAATAMVFAAGIIRKKRPDFLHLFLFAGLSYAALTTFRAGMFFALCSTAFLGYGLSGIRSLSGRRAGRAGYLISALAVLILLPLLIIPRTILKKPVINEGLLPVKVSSFARNERLPGNIYHPYEWGGYLIWRLYPKYRVFIDGRALGLMDEYKKIRNASPGWEGIAENHNVNTVLFWPLFPYEGRVPPIVFALLKSEGWSPVYWDLQSIVFVRKDMAARTIRKEAVWELLKSLILNNQTKNPDDAGNHIALGELYLHMGMKRSAHEELLKAFSLSPEDPEVKLLLRAFK